MWTKPALAPVRFAKHYEYNHDESFLVDLPLSPRHTHQLNGKNSGIRSIRGSSNHFK